MTAHITAGSKSVTLSASEMAAFRLSKGQAAPSWRANEPSGYTALTELTFTQPVDDTPGWNEYSTENFDRISDPSNPSDTDMIGRLKYPAGAAGGGSFVNIGHDTIAANNAKELYYCSAFKMSPNFQYHSTGTNKIFFINVTDYGGGGDPYFINLDSDFRPPKIIPVLQGALPRTWTDTADVTVDKDEWFTVETQLIMNTPGNADGTIRQWLNGALTIDFDDVEFVNATYEWSNGPKLQPTWGGSGDTVDEDFYLYCAGIYVAWRA